jgi:hypothetical protein
VSLIIRFKNMYRIIGLSLTNIADAVEVVSMGYVISALGREQGDVLIVLCRLISF